MATFINVPYAHASGHDLLLDLYLPATTGPGHRDAAPPGHRVPARRRLAGGRQGVGDRAEIAGLVGETGYALASVNYRLSNEGHFPTQIIDCKAAVRWLRANAGRFGLDPRRIGVLGFSAGGHLAALLGTTGGVAKLEDPRRWATRKPIQPCAGGLRRVRDQWT